MIRNLLYNCWAPSHSNEWRLNVEKLCSYSAAFNARKLVLIKTGPGTTPVDEVQDAFRPLGDVEFALYPNVAELGEVSGFIESLSMLESVREDEATFYAHTKGTKYERIELPNLTAIRRWRNRMYYECLHDPGKIEELLKDHACCGGFKQEGLAPPLPKSVAWHFAGTFWWVKHSSLFGQTSWRHIRKNFYGVEGYLGALFPSSEAAKLCSIPSDRRGGLYTVECEYLCRRCGKTFSDWPRLTGPKVKVCKHCFKREGELLRVIPDEFD